MKCEMCGYENKDVECAGKKPPLPTPDKTALSFPTPTKPTFKDKLRAFIQKLIKEPKFLAQFVQGAFLFIIGMFMLIEVLKMII